MDMYAFVLMSIVTLLIIALAVFVVTGQVRHEPHFRINKSLVLGSMIISFTLAYVIFDSYGAAILSATFIGVLSIYINVWYELMFHAECGMNSHGRTYTAYTSRPGPDPRNDPFSGQGPSR